MSKMTVNGVNDDGERAGLEIELKTQTDGKIGIPTVAELTNQKAVGGDAKHDDMAGSALAKVSVSALTTYVVDMRSYGRATVGFIAGASVNYGVTIAWSSDGIAANIGASATLLAAGTGGNRTAVISSIEGNYAHIALTPSSAETFWGYVEGRELA